MDTEKFLRFVGITSALGIGAVVLAAMISPPDPFTLLLYATPLWLVAPVVAYVLTYRGGHPFRNTRA